ncbi:translation elongation factor 1 subunit beta [Saccharomycopsis crataegensis]|uniref:Translation elongation factor 1 subunit beta n=1 Tax=Saccharomycopsis crataegensis TaxID=43959 RepID=A0AAV5QT53_9ASCO|nr:translation elongation factor 1 subunit beta [Saccharomycopsis crataegensis]
MSSIADLEKKLTATSYVDGAAPSQADVAAFKTIQKEYPSFTRWLAHIHTFVDDFESLPAATSAAAEEEDDDEVDLFGSDDDEVDEEAEALKAKRIAEYNAKKANKPKPAAKSIVTLDVKPWDDETDLEELVANVKKIEQEGLTWGAHTWIPVGYGIKKLQINLVIEDEKVSLDELQQTIEEDEDHVQSTDVAAMQKL